MSKERLTEKSNIKGVFKYMLKDNSDAEVGYFKDYDAFYSHREVVDKLGTYEELEEQGLLIRLPCKPGSTIYSIRHLPLSKKNIISEDENVDMFYLLLAVAENRFGETVFLTKSEAVEKLRELEGK